MHCQSVKHIVTEKGTNYEQRHIHKVHRWREMEVKTEGVQAAMQAGKQAGKQTD